MMIYYVVFCFIIFDVATGLLKALHNKELNSKVLREGLYHKASEVITIIGAGLLSYAIHYVELGINIPLLPAVATYICIMELISIIENLCAVNPALCKLFEPYLEKMKTNDAETETKGG